MQSPPISEGSTSPHPSHPFLFLYLSWHLPVQDEEHFFCTKAFQRSGRVLLNIGSGRFETSKETLLSVPSYFGSLLSGRFSFLAVALLCHGAVTFLGSTNNGKKLKDKKLHKYLLHDFLGGQRVVHPKLIFKIFSFQIRPVPLPGIDLQDDGSIFIDRNPKYFSYILEFLRNGKRFQAPSTQQEKDELLLEAQFYGLSDLVKALRRFRVAETHFMMVNSYIGSQGLEEDKEITQLRGLRRAAASFDIEDPDCFEMSVFLWDCWMHEGYPQNHPKIFVGLGQEGCLLSEAWCHTENALPQHGRSPFQDPDMNPLWPTTLDVTECERFWPQTVEVPPGLSDGVFLAITDVVIGDDPEHDLAGFLCQIVVKGKFQSNVVFSQWSPHPFCSITMCFDRSFSAKWTVKVGNDNQDIYVNKQLNLEELGLDLQAPYRPVIYFGTNSTVSVWNTFGISVEFQ